MSRRMLGKIAQWLIIVAVLGCTRTVPVAVEPVGCPVTAEILAQRCEKPQPIADGATFGGMLQISELDRQALRDCAAHDRLLADIITKCRQALKEYNDRLSELNRKITNKP